jgi:hypothetical protein
LVDIGDPGAAVDGDDAQAALVSFETNAAAGV